ncbi:glycoside hydrolase family 25 protein [Amycolatopsis sp. NBC_01480]|uniref:glycoside hydrolase family 25 protein n=1 Tax=Amycolatopsis sp. NBC_01480 TaxID=2903562 RepID=UPI002E2CE63F|nr:glycoside hydrolase family 25 protein [Amycolatopsis sp. NBC_01480]
MALGIDIYRSFQTIHDWPAVKRHGVGYVYVKLSDGASTPLGGRGDAEVAGAKSVGIPVGGYHFVQTNPAPERQADVLLGEVIRLDATGCVPMLDLEDNPPGSRLPNIPDAEKQRFAEAFLNRLDAKGFRPGVYLNNALAKRLRPDRWSVPGLVIWIARYGARPDAAAGRYDLHQYSSTGAVPGISARGVDLDESYTTAHLGARKTGAETPEPQEDDMPDRELLPTDGGGKRTRAVTLTVPKTAAEVIVSLGWVSMWVTKLAVFGPSPAAGTNTLYVEDYATAPKRLDGGRPWRIPLDAARREGEPLTVELTYALAPASADKPDARATIGFR